MVLPLKKHKWNCFLNSTHFIYKVKLFYSKTFILELKLNKKKTLWCIYRLYKKYAKEGVSLRTLIIHNFFFVFKIFNAVFVIDAQRPLYYSRPKSYYQKAAIFIRNHQKDQISICGFECIPLKRYIYLFLLLQPPLRPFGVDSNFSWHIYKFLTSTDI